MEKLHADSVFAVGWGVLVLPQWHGLHISGVPALNDQMLQLVADNCKGLRKLSIGYCQVRHRRVLGSKVPSKMVVAAQESCYCVPTIMAATGSQTDECFFHSKADAFIVCSCVCSLLTAFGRRRRLQSASDDALRPYVYFHGI